MSLVVAAGSRVVGCCLRDGAVVESGLGCVVDFSDIPKMRFQFEAASRPHGTPARLTLVTEANGARRLATTLGPQTPEA